MVSRRDWCPDQLERTPAVLEDLEEAAKLNLPCGAQGEIAAASDEAAPLARLEHARAESADAPPVPSSTLFWAGRRGIQRMTTRPTVLRNLAPPAAPLRPMKSAPAQPARHSPFLSYDRVINREPLSKNT